MGILPKLIFFLVGGIFTVVGGGMAYYTWISGSWPTASAVVTTSQVTWANDSNNGGKTAKAQVFYDFEVGDHHYTGNTVSYDDYGSSFSSHAQGIVDAYPVGKTIQIHYELGSPQYSVIRGGSVGFFPLIFLGLGLLFVALALLAILKDLFFLVFALFLAN